jgi:actin-related protein
LTHDGDFKCKFDLDQTLLKGFDLLNLNLDSLGELIYLDDINPSYKTKEFFLELVFEAYEAPGVIFFP